MNRATWWRLAIPPLVVCLIGLPAALLIAPKHADAFVIFACGYLIAYISGVWNTVAQLLSEIDDEK